MKTESLIVKLLLLYLLFTSGLIYNVPLKKALIYDNYTLADTYVYNKTQRFFQWDKISATIDSLDNFINYNNEFGYLVNYKNRKGIAPLVKTYTTNAYNSIQDTFGVFKYQAIPLYGLQDTLYPERYGRDGSFVSICRTYPNFYAVKVASIPNKYWLVPKKYVKTIETKQFKHLIVIDRKNQNIATLEHADSVWLIRSMNPATTGVYRPPFSRVTPTGLFLLQEKLNRMLYYKDGTTNIEGYAPYANRFCCGGYIHGVPVNNPQGSIIEYSPTLGTIPRSHMCVRNVTSHAKYIYDAYPIEATIIYILE